MRRILPLLLLLTSCSHPAFRKATADAAGYVAKPTPIPEIVELELPGGMKDEPRAEYAARAAGEECSARGMPYFDQGLTHDGNARAFCYAHASAPHLGATFAMKAAASSPAELRVEDTQLGTFTPLRPWDVVRKVNGREVHDVAELKEAIFLAGRKGLKRVGVLIERSEIPLSLDCPLVTDGAQLGTPETLQVLRTKVP